MRMETRLPRTRFPIHRPSTIRTTSSMITKGTTRTNSSNTMIRISNTINSNTISSSMINSSMINSSITKDMISNSTINSSTIKGTTRTRIKISSTMTKITIKDMIRTMARMLVQVRAPPPQVVTTWLKRTQKSTMKQTHSWLGERPCSVMKDSERRNPIPLL